MRFMCHRTCNRFGDLDPAQHSSVTRPGLVAWVLYREVRATGPSLDDGPCEILGIFSSVHTAWNRVRALDPDLANSGWRNPEKKRAKEDLCCVGDHYVYTIERHMVDEGAPAEMAPVPGFETEGAT